MLDDRRYLRLLREEVGENMIKIHSIKRTPRPAHKLDTQKAGVVYREARERMTAQLKRELGWHEDLK